jgi:hypothetical protein
MFFRNSLWPGASMIVNERFSGPEGDPRRVHRDVLRLLLQQGVQEERVLKLHPLGPARGLDALLLAVGHRVGVEEQAADQGRLAVVDVPDDDQLQVVRDRRLRRCGAGGCGGDEGRAVSESAVIDLVT